MGTYNKYENEIAYDDNILVERVDLLLKSGANVNAQEDEEVENGHVLDSLFQSILYNYNKESKSDLLEILKCFIDNGLDLKKYGNSIISDFHYIHDKRQKAYEMTKIILNEFKEKIDVEVAKDGIGIEVSWLVCTYPNDCYDNPDDYANYLDGIMKILENYEQGKEYNSIFPCDDAIGEIFKQINVSGNIYKVTKDRIEYKPIKGRNTQLWTNIKLGEKKLVIEDNYWAYIDNSNNNTGTNIFTENANTYFENEKLTEIKYSHYSIQGGCGRLCELLFTNNKRLVYGIDQDMEYVEIDVNRIKTVY